MFLLCSMPETQLEYEKVSVSEEDEQINCSKRQVFRLIRSERAHTKECIVIN